MKTVAQIDSSWNVKISGSFIEGNANSPPTFNSSGNLVIPGTFIEGNSQPTFTRSSVAYKSDGTQVAANTPRFETGKFGQAVMVEEGTTNLISGTNGVSNFSSFYNGAQLVTITHPVWGIQVSAIKLPAGTTVPGAYSQTLNLSTNTYYTVSFDVWATGASQFDVDLYPDTLPQQNQSIDGSFRRITWTLTSSSTNMSSCQLRFFNDIVKPNPYDIYITNVQIEQKSYATSFITGTRSSETLTIPTAGVLDPAQGTIECWVYVNDIIKRVDGIYRVIWYALPVGDTVNGWLVLDHFGNSANWRIAVSNGSTSTAYSISDSYTPNGWHFFSLTYNKSDGSIRLLIDGVLRFSTIGAPLPNSYANLFVGLAKEQARWCDSFIDDLRISSIARSDAEIAAAYQSNAPLPVDQYTTAKLNFDGTLFLSSPIQLNSSGNLVIPGTFIEGVIL